LLLVAAVGVSPAAAGQQSRTRLARVELAGPLQGAELDYPDGSGASLALELVAGERRTLVVPLAAPTSAPDAAPEIVVGGEGEVRFAGWVQSDVELLESQWRRLSPALRGRPRPAALGDPGRSGPSVAALLLTCAGFTLVLRLRRQGLVALGVGALAAAVAYGAAARPASRGEVLRLLEGDGVGGGWLEVRVGRERLTVASAEAAWVETRPARAALRARVDEAPAGLRWTFMAPRATVVHVGLPALASDTLMRAGPNRLAALDPVWVREADGAWARHGAWDLGAALPEALPGPGEPPGWLNPALPLGTGILVARDASAPQAPGEQTWVRVVGF